MSALLAIAGGVLGALALGSVLQQVCGPRCGARSPHKVSERPYPCDRAVGHTGPCGGWLRVELQGGAMEVRREWTSEADWPVFPLRRAREA